MFVILQFTSDSACDMVPESWLVSNTLCLWPPPNFKPYEVATFIKRLKAPEESWRTCSVKVLERATNFAEARKKLKAANKIDSAERGRGKRNGVSKKRQSLLLDYSDDEEDTIPRKRSKSLPLSNRPPAEDSALVISHQTDTSTLPLAGFTSESTSLTPNCDMSGNTKGNDVTKTVFSQLTQMLAIQEKHSKILGSLLKKSSAMNFVHEEMTKNELGISFPITSDEELKKVEAFAMTAEGEVALLQKFKSIGGNTFKNHIRRVLKLLLTDSMAEEYSWLGCRDKKMFYALKISQIVINAAMEVDGTISRAQVENVMKDWLRHAKERKLYTEKKELLSYTSNSAQKPEEKISLNQENNIPEINQEVECDTNSSASTSLQQTSVQQGIAPSQKTLTKDAVERRQEIDFTLVQELKNTNRELQSCFLSENEVFGKLVAKTLDKMSNETASNSKLYIMQYLHDSLYSFTSSE